MLYIDRLTFSIIIVSNVISIYLLLFTFQVKTQSQMAVLFYNTGPSSNQDFVALEIWKGRPRLLVDQVITSVHDNGFLNTVIIDVPKN